MIEELQNIDEEVIFLGLVSEETNGHNGVIKEPISLGWFNPGSGIEL